jgi:hypothetical protein
MSTPLNLLRNRLMKVIAAVQKGFSHLTLILFAISCLLFSTPLNAVASPNFAPQQYLAQFNSPMSPREFQNAESEARKISENPSYTPDQKMEMLFNLIDRVRVSNFPAPPNVKRAILHKIFEIVETLQ